MMKKHEPEARQELYGNTQGRVRRFEQPEEKDGSAKL